MPRALLALVLLSGCVLTEDNVADQYADAWCAQERRCDRGDFDSTWDDMGACKDDAAELFDDIADFYDLLDCELSLPAAREALRSLRRASCEEFDQGDWGSEDDLWECGG